MASFDSLMSRTDMALPKHREWVRTALCYAETDGYLEFFNTRRRALDFTFAWGVIYIEGAKVTFDEADIPAAVAMLKEKVEHQEAIAATTIQCAWRSRVCASALRMLADCKHNPTHLNERLHVVVAACRALGRAPPPPTRAAIPSMVFTDDGRIITIACTHAEAGFVLTTDVSVVHRDGSTEAFGYPAGEAPLHDLPRFVLLLDNFLWVFQAVAGAVRVHRLNVGTMAMSRLTVISGAPPAGMERCFAVGGVVHIEHAGRTHTFHTGKRAWRRIGDCALTEAMDGPGFPPLSATRVN